MKSIYTLIPDIQQILKTKGGWFNSDLAQSFGCDVSRRLSEQFGKFDKSTLRLSGMGDKCPKALWHSINTPELAEPLPPWAEMKYAYGHILEALAIALAKASGHTVTGEQDELLVDGVLGHRDCVVDGCLVDVKSCSSIQFSKFRDGTVAKDDAFGYLLQLDGYLCGSQLDDLVVVKDRAYILAIDKVLGHMALYEHEYRERNIRERISKYKEICGLHTPPQCTCGIRPIGASGNMGLDIRASYSPYKHLCFPHLRTFAYAAGLTHLVKVVRTPDVPEIKHDKYIAFGKQCH